MGENLGGRISAKCPARENRRRSEDKRSFAVWDTQMKTEGMANRKAYRGEVLVQEGFLSLEDRFHLILQTIVHSPGRITSRF